ncbi:MAG: hypothetical protein HY909_04005 [Deltaproteobacteria bacterium]|nr:hypothetical protein [Deltaproteobacteria bacterium]
MTDRSGLGVEGTLAPRGDVLELTVRQLRRGALVGVLAGATATVGVAGCGTEADMDPSQSGVEEATNNGRDWAQNQGRRNTSMVQFRRESWHQYANCGSRGGCSVMEVFVKVYVRRAEGADLTRKRVGIVARVANGNGRAVQFLGTYFATRPDGMEEWHVRAFFQNYEAAYFMFNAWYQDGRGNTYFDDNGGELHVVYPNGPNAIVRQAWDGTNVRASSNGVRGHIAVDIMDLDYDKDLQVVYTTDGWATTRTMRMGSRGQSNQLYFERDQYGDAERWGVDVDLPGSTQLEYAIVYRHGVATGATPYEFWDNAGGHNYRVTRCDGPRC